MELCALILFAHPRRNACAAVLPRRGSSRRIIAWRGRSRRHLLRIPVLHRQLGFALRAEETPVALGPSSLPGLVKGLEEEGGHVVGLGPDTDLLKVPLLLLLVARVRCVLVADGVSGPTHLAEDDGLRGVRLAHALVVLDSRGHGRV